MFLLFMFSGVMWLIVVLKLLVRMKLFCGYWLVIYCRLFCYCCIFFMCGVIVCIVMMVGFELLIGIRMMFGIELVLFELFFEDLIIEYLFRFGVISIVVCYDCGLFCIFGWNCMWCIYIG